MAFNIVRPDELTWKTRPHEPDEAPRHVADLLADAEPFRKRSQAFREEWAFNFGTSVEVGAREIARLAEAHRGRGAAGRPR